MLAQALHLLEIDFSRLVRLRYRGICKFLGRTVSVNALKGAISINPIVFIRCHGEQLLAACSSVLSDWQYVL